MITRMSTPAKLAICARRETGVPLSGSLPERTVAANPDNLIRLERILDWGKILLILVLSNRTNPVGSFQSPRSVVSITATSVASPEYSARGFSPFQPSHLLSVQIGLRPIPRAYTLTPAELCRRTRQRMAAA